MASPRYSPPPGLVDCRSTLHANAGGDFRTYFICPAPSEKGPGTGKIHVTGGGRPCAVRRREEVSGMNLGRMIGAGGATGLRWLVLGLCGASLQGAAPGAADRADAALRVMTFNIRYAEPRDGDNRWEKRRAAVAALIAAEADVAGLQEVLAGQMAELRRDLPDFESVGRGREFEPGDGEACPVFYRRARFERVAAGTFWLSEKPEEPGSRDWGNTLPRICTWVELRERVGGRRLKIFNLHLDNASAEARRRGAGLVRRRAEAEDGVAGAVILLGDFNEGPEGPAVAEAGGAAGWRDAWRERGAGEGGTFNGWRREGPFVRIDYIFYRGGGLEARSARVPLARAAAGGGWASDHFPVIASFAWR